MRSVEARKSMAAVDVREQCDAVVEKLAADLRVLASNFFMRNALDKHAVLMRQFDKRINTFVKRRRTR
jgi:hypothetical protein